MVGGNCEKGVEKKGNQKKKKKSLKWLVDLGGVNLPHNAHHHNEVRGKLGGTAPIFTPDYGGRSHGENELGSKSGKKRRG